MTQPIPFADIDSTEPAELVAAIKARRGGELLKLDRMLLHSPNFADGWNYFLGKVRTELTIPAQLAELAICYIAKLNGADYEFEQHAPLFLRAGGRAEQVSALDRAPVDKQLFSSLELAVLALTKEMTHEIRVQDSTLEALKLLLGDEKKLVEIIGVVAAYNMVSRFLVAAGVKTEKDEE
ncbi:MAG: carboxymuconolactone decarboxylase family protein [Pseudomonadota bacterium]